MKFLVLLSLLIGSSVYAQTTETSKIVFDDEVVYLSWCDGTKVMGPDANGQEQLRYDCADQGQQCRISNIGRMGQIVLIAACLNP